MRQAERSPLLAACKGGHSKTVKLLIDKGADVNKVNRVSLLPA